jgi:hypothetical protein
MSAAANKERLRLLMLAKKKTKDKPKRVAAPATEEPAPIQVVEQEDAVPEAKRARVEELSEPMVAVPVDASGLVNVEAELARVFGAAGQAAELVPEEELEGEGRDGEDEEEGEGKEAEGPAAENELSAMMRQRIFSQTKAQRAKQQQEEEDESDVDEDADIFAGL